MEGMKYTVKCFHSQAINVLPKDFIPIAYDNNGNIEAFQHNSLQIYGILWHPERMDTPVLPTDVKILFE